MDVVARGGRDGGPVSIPGVCSCFWGLLGVLGCCGASLGHGISLGLCIPAEDVYSYVDGDGICSSASFSHTTEDISKRLVVSSERINYVLL